MATILWGNVGINVLLTLLSNSVMAGLSAFLFSTILITFLGEIIPQAYFSRHALKMASRLSPVLIFYQYLLYPVTKPSALMLNWMVGQESIHYFKEKSLTNLIHRHIHDEDADEIDLVEGTGAINFLTIDDIAADQEGEVLNPDSIIALEHQRGKPVFPDWTGGKDNAFLSRINKSGEKWIVFTDKENNPSWVMDADVIDRDIILLWSQKKQIITGADILGRLLRGIANNN